MKYSVVSKEFNAFILNIKEAFNKEKNTLFKQRNIIKVVEFEEKKYAVKSFKVPHLLNQVVYRFFRKSKAERSYANSVRLMELGIETPKPIGYIEFPKLFLFKESYYISKLFDYDFEIRAVLSDKNFKQREKILRLFVEFTYDLHQKGVYHSDYSPGNVLVKKIEERYIFSIIDVNRMKFLTFNDALRMQNLAKLTNAKEDNSFLVKEYATISKIDEKILTLALDEALEKQQKYLESKKRLKKIKKVKGIKYE